MKKFIIFICLIISNVITPIIPPPPPAVLTTPDSTPNQPGPKIITPTPLASDSPKPLSASPLPTPGTPNSAPKISPPAPALPTPTPALPTPSPIEPTPTPVVTTPSPVMAPTPFSPPPTMPTDSTTTPSPLTIQDTATTTSPTAKNTIFKPDIHVKIHNLGDRPCHIDDIYFSFSINGTSTLKKIKYDIKISKDVTKEFSPIIPFNLPESASVSYTGVAKITVKNQTITRNQTQAALDPDTIHLINTGNTWKEATKKEMQSISHIKSLSSKESKETPSKNQPDLSKSSNVTSNDSSAAKISTLKSAAVVVKQSKPVAQESKSTKITSSSAKTNNTVITAKNDTMEPDILHE